MAIKGKKGLERWMLITIIIAIASFAIILIYFFMMKPTAIVDKEACRASIIMRAMPVAGDIAKANTPLNCRTEEIIIDSRYKTEDQIKGKIADAMAECWNMVGKGELDFMSSSLWNQDYCLICSRIEFDKKTTEKFPVLMGILSYMNNTEMSINQKSYYEYIWRSTMPGGIDANVDTSKDYVVMFSMNKQGWLREHKEEITTVVIAGTVIAAVIFTGGAAAPVAGTLTLATAEGAAAATTTATATIGTIVVKGLVTGAAKIAIMGALGHMAVTSFIETDVGEAGLHLMPYDSKEIDKQCTRFENAP